ncbi:hypothetical protein TRVL_09239 [Trypanosoma vivax]|nr:hypothetical protein TRVL_09239 [Trypanosoma vivax]
MTVWRNLACAPALCLSAALRDAQATRTTLVQKDTCDIFWETNAMRYAERFAGKEASRFDAAARDNAAVSGRVNAVKAGRAEERMATSTVKHGERARNEGNAP